VDFDGNVISKVRVDKTAARERRPLRTFFSAAERGRWTHLVITAGPVPCGDDGRADASLG
jgi:hypothetical protein